MTSTGSAPRRPAAGGHAAPAETLPAARVSESGGDAAQTNRGWVRPASGPWLSVIAGALRPPGEGDVHDRRGAGVGRDQGHRPLGSWSPLTVHGDEARSRAGYAPLRVPPLSWKHIFEVTRGAAVDDLGRDRAGAVAGECEGPSRAALIRRRVEHQVLKVRVAGAAVPVGCGAGVAVGRRRPIQPQSSRGSGRRRSRSGSLKAATPKGWESGCRDARSAGREAGGVRRETAVGRRSEDRAGGAEEHRQPEAQVRAAVAPAALADECLDAGLRPQARRSPPSEHVSTEASSTEARRPRLEVGGRTCRPGSPPTRSPPAQLSARGRAQAPALTPTARAHGSVGRPRRRPGGLKAPPLDGSVGSGLDTRPRGVRAVAPTLAPQRGVRLA